ncbi:MAG: site-2 protease family protein [Patescibacteria group bacterium]
MEFLFIIAVLIMSVVIHEVAHGYMALALGDNTAKYQNRLTLNPLSHLDPVGSFFVPLMGYMLGGFIIGWAKPVPFNPYNLKNQKWGEAMVAFAGPLSNIVIAIVFGLFMRLTVAENLLSGPALGLLGFIVSINITLAVFNLIPLPPLDGSKILFAFLPLKMQNVRLAFERFGIVLVIFFIFFIWQYLGPLIFKLTNIIIGY